jgi:outer membrane protein assembly factor BamB
MIRPLLLTMLLAAIGLGLGGRHLTSAMILSQPAERGDVAIDPSIEPTLGPNDWPFWRGPTGNGIAPATAKVPLEWGPSKNVRWKADVPGRGHASPIVVGNRVLIATCDESTGVQSLLCYGRDDGRLLWSTKLHEGKLVKINDKNSHASLTPAYDGRRVYTLFAIDESLRASALDLDGKIVWQTTVSAYDSEHGPGGSPLLYRSALIVSAEDMSGGCIAALDRATGKPIWKAPRRRLGKSANYSTPVVGTIAGRPQLIVHGFDFVTAYNPDTGAVLWVCDGPTEVCGNTPLFDDRRVYASGGYPGKWLLAVRADGRGDVTRTHVAWSDRKAVSYVPSGILRDGRLYIVNDDGIATCYDTADGRVVWRERLEGNFTSSFILVGDRLYVSNETGTTFVLAVGDTFRKLAQNSLPGGQLASPAVSGDRLFIRTDRELYCLSESP